MSSADDEQPYDAAEERAALLRLCQRYGIAPDYYDIWGKHTLVPDHGLRSLLRAMGVEAGDRAQVEASLRAYEENQAAQAIRAPLPPVVVFWLDAQPWTLKLKAGVRDARVRWLLVEEGGAQHEGAVQDFRINLPNSVPYGYHRLDLRIEISVPEFDETRADRVTQERIESRFLASTLIIVAPPRCYLPPLLRAGQRVWGPAVQLYSLRSNRNWGIGDFNDLAKLVRMSGKHGAALVGLNPLHALFAHNPDHASPYAPSSRRFFHILYLDVEAVEEYLHCSEARAQVMAPEFQARLRALRSMDLVDYKGVAAVKIQILELLYDHFRRVCLSDFDSRRAQDFRAFQTSAGLALRQHALFEALQEHFHGLDPLVSGWPEWSYEYRDPNSPAVTEFARSHAERVEFFEYLQWQAELQLAAVGLSSLDSRLGIGLYQDLAVSVDRSGAESWAAQDLYTQSASAGCPPDDFNLHGQDWGLLPLLPERLRARAYGPFIAVLRANMRHAGALRIDHVMGLARLFWVPRGDLPEAGAYVSYPFEHLLAILTLESQRNRCLVIGEDLGTVPDEVRHAMDLRRILSYRVLYFCRGPGGQFQAPSEFPLNALVTSATHDLATLAGFWEGRDLELRQALGLFPREAMRMQQLEERKRDCAQLLSALQRESLLPPEVSPEPRWPLAMTQSLAMAVQEYLAHTPSRVLVVQLEDVFGCRDQVNLPGTVDQYPNWRRKLPLELEKWEEDGRFAELARRLAPERRQ
ncbi:MAG TPA: 4-alpha-glucanotransferase [Burkholderiaceae bacterium]|nr:4-alpha-glucanotransferase [Burkholderiaceae bacterium]